MIETIKFVGFIALYVYACWLMYVLVIGLYRAWLKGVLHPVVKALALPWIVVGLVMDVILQQIATGLFLDPARLSRGEWLLTQRLKRYMREDTGWRMRVAKWICEHALDLFDPRGSHC